MKTAGYFDIPTVVVVLLVETVVIGSCDFVFSFISCALFCFHFVGLVNRANKINIYTHQKKFCNS